MLVNGKVWPYLDVEPRLYRLRILNGCNPRILNLDIGGAVFWQIGAEGGLFDVRVPIGQLVLAPAERADLIVDFCKFAGSTIVMKNHRPPKPVANPAPALESVLQIRIGTTVSQLGPAAVPARLPGRKADLRGPIAATRYITLNEVEPEKRSGRSISAARASTSRRPRRRGSERPRTGSTST
jgi:spore coat protein A